jgi:taurine-pyruvate aminotransferase
MDTLYDADRTNDPRAIIEADRAHVWHHLIQNKVFETVDPRIIVEGKGLRVWDIKGKEHVDAVSGGVWTVNIGYGRERVADAVRDQLVKMCYFAGSAGSIPGARYSEALSPGCRPEPRLLRQLGSEANEKAFKMVRQIAHKHHGGRKHKILYRDRDYHGTTIACLSAGGQQERNAHYGPFTPGFVQVPHCLEYRAGDQAAKATASAPRRPIEDVILREGPEHDRRALPRAHHRRRRHHRPPKGYWERVQEICRKYDILLHIDEVVCGFGRTGTWFGYQQYGIQPDIVTMAKGVASGYAAISCCVTTEAVFDMFKDDTDTLATSATSPPSAAARRARRPASRSWPSPRRRTSSATPPAWASTSTASSRAAGQAPLHRRGPRPGLFQGAELVADRDTREPLDESKVQAIVADCMAQGVIIGASNRSCPASTTRCSSRLR